MSELLHDLRTRRALRTIRANLQQREEQREQAIQIALGVMELRGELDKEATRLETARPMPTDVWFKNIVEYDALDEMAFKIENVLTVIDENEQADVLAVQAMMHYYKV